MTSRLFLARVAFATALSAFLFTPLSRADEGHSHDAGPAVPSGPALPRFATASELFELVGVLDGRQLTVYLDRFDDNAPVENATLALEIDGTAVSLTPHGAGTFEGTLAQVPRAGLRAVTATIAAGGDTDLLAAELDLHDEHAHAGTGGGARGVALVSLAALVLFAAMAAIATAVRARRARRAAIGGAA